MMTASAFSMFMMTASALTMFMSMVAAHRIRVIVKLSRQISLHLRIRIPLCVREELNSSLGQRIPCAPADTAANQHVNAPLAQETCQSAVSLPVRADHLAFYYFSVFHIIDFELL